MGELARVVDLEHLGDFRLKLTFSDGLVRELDFERSMVGDAFAQLRDPVEFGRAQVDLVAGTVSWPNGIDLDPDVLHGDHAPASGSSPQVLREYHLRATG